MNGEALEEKCRSHLNRLCAWERCVGSDDNRQATKYFKEQLSSLGWATESHGFDAMDWKEGGAILQVGEEDFETHVSPYSNGCDVECELVSASNVEELQSIEMTGRLLLLHGEIAKEQLMPKNFVFYNPEEHRRIISLLEEGEPAGIVCATGRNASLAGGVYPFPLVEDGDFDIPSAYMTEEEGARLLRYTGKQVCLKSVSRRIPGKGYNVLGRKGRHSQKRIVVTAHIDAKKGTPGAIDNATGVIVLLLLAELLTDYDGNHMLEIVPLNGEDHYAVPGQMLYLKQNQGRFEEISLNINIDGAGYYKGESAFSFYGIPESLERAAKQIMSESREIVEGVQWPQGDHSIFIQQGCPAIAVSSRWFTENIAAQEITHTPKDSPEIVDVSKVVGIAEVLAKMIRGAKIT